LEENAGTVGVADLFNFSVHAGEEVSEGFSEGQHEPEDFSKSLEAFTVYG